MTNLNNIFVLHYTKASYNAHHSYPQNANRYAGTFMSENLLTIKRKADELKIKGCSGFECYTRTGRKLALSF